MRPSVGLSNTVLRHYVKISSHNLPPIMWRCRLRPDTLKPAFSYARFPAGLNR